jgi:hypothetical protein
MQEIIFLLAVLIKKEVITKEEGIKIKGSISSGILTSNLGEMVGKINEALESSVDIEKLDAADLFSK